jgi:limonene-1,2-epoxide hydrolase
MTPTKQASEKLVRDFLGSWEGRDLDTICGAFADDAVYHNVPVKPIEGIAGIRAIFQAFLDAFADAKLDIITLAAEPGLVLAERVDYFTMKDGRKVVLPVTGVFVVKNDQITRFSDYFDLADFERQSGFKL